MEDPKTSNPSYSPQRESEGSWHMAFLAPLLFHLQPIKCHPELGAAQGGNGMFWSLGQSSESQVLVWRPVWDIQFRVPGHVGW